MSEYYEKIHNLETNLKDFDTTFESQEVQELNRQKNMMDNFINEISLK